MFTPGVTVGEASKWGTKLDADLKLILQHLELNEYEDVFERERITSVRRASTLSKQDLCELGMRIGERSVFLSEISRRTPGHSRHNSRNSFALSDLAILEEQTEGETQTGHEVLYLQPQSTACSLQDVPLSPRRPQDAEPARGRQVSNSSTWGPDLPPPIGVTRQGELSYAPSFRSSGSWVPAVELGVHSPAAEVYAVGYDGSAEPAAPPAKGQPGDASPRLIVPSTRLSRRAGGPRDSLLITRKSVRMLPIQDLDLTAEPEKESCCSRRVKLALLALTLLLCIGAAAAVWFLVPSGEGRGQTPQAVEAIEVALPGVVVPTSTAPSSAPTFAPTAAPTLAPSAAPTRAPSAAPTPAPTENRCPAGFQHVDVDLSDGAGCSTVELYEGKPVAMDMQACAAVCASLPNCTAFEFGEASWEQPVVPMCVTKTCYTMLEPLQAPGWTSCVQE